MRFGICLLTCSASGPNTNPAACFAKMVFHSNNLASYTLRCSSGLSWTPNFLWGFLLQIVCHQHLCRLSWFQHVTQLCSFHFCQCLLGKVGNRRNTVLYRKDCYFITCQRWILHGWWLEHHRLSELRSGDWVRWLSTASDVSWPNSVELRLMALDLASLWLGSALLEASPCKTFSNKCRTTSLHHLREIILSHSTRPVQSKCSLPVQHLSTHRSVATWFFCRLRFRRRPYHGAGTRLMCDRLWHGRVRRIIKNAIRHRGFINGLIHIFWRTFGWAWLDRTADDQTQTVVLVDSARRFRQDCRQHSLAGTWWISFGDQIHILMAIDRSVINQILDAGQFQVWSLR